MDQYYTGADGRLLFNGRRMAKVREWAIRGQVGALPITSLADTAENYTSGIKSASGSCTVWYYNDAPADIMSLVFRTGAATDTSKVQLELGWGEKLIRATVLFTETEVASRTGDAMAVDCQFVVCGDLLEVSF